MKHLINNNETYLGHLLFAGNVGLTLVTTGCIFLLHAILPICNIPSKWNLSNTTAKLEKWNCYIIRRLK